MIEEIETRYGRMFVPDTDIGQYWWLKNIGASPEDEYIERVCDILRERPRGIAVDVGANFGCWTLPLLKVAAAVHAFEPQRHVYEQLRRTLIANCAENARIYNLAVGESSGVAMIPDIALDVGTNFGGVSINAPHPEHPLARLRPVSQISLDDALAIADDVAFIKADVEGSEMAVLKGARKLIARCRPILFVEALHPKTDTGALADLIVSMGYALTEQLDNFLAMPL